MLGLMRVSGGVGTSKILASSDFLNFRANRRLVPRSRRGAWLGHAAISRRERETPTLSRARRDRAGTPTTEGDYRLAVVYHDTLRPLSPQEYKFSPYRGSDIPDGGFRLTPQRFASDAVFLFPGEEGRD